MSAPPATVHLSPTGPRLLAPIDRAADASLAVHLGRYGPLPTGHDAESLAAVLQAAGLTGRGGAGFPTHRKLRAVAAARGRPVVVGNAAESEPASAKDRALLTRSPHLVLDGLHLVAQALGARGAYLYVHPGAVEPARRALAERAADRTDGVRVELVTAPQRFLAGQESALAARINGGPAKPVFTPPRVYERGVRGRPTLVQNVETLAHLALVARYGPAWFRAVGTPDEPGTMLATVTGAVAAPGAVELPIGSPVRAALAAAGGLTGRPAAVLVGGYHGAWLPAGALDVALTNAELAPYGATLGAGVIVALPVGVCGVVETARVLRYLADQSAGQCGPCLSGLPLIARAVEMLAQPRRHRDVRGHLDRWAALVERRGACHHPDGTVRFLRSSLTVFAAELAQHERGRCVAVDAAAVLPTPPAPSGPDSWR